jgi:hypothetical protein
MPLLSEVITSLIEIQETIGDREVVLTDVAHCDIPLPDAPGMGVTIVPEPKLTDDEASWINSIHRRN